MEIEDNTSTTMPFCQVESIEELGEGTRVCLDFIDILAPDEGIYIGNTGHGYMMVLSENRKTTTYPPRPFRINAGGIHQYLLLEDNVTCYLCDLQPGVKIPIYNPEHNQRLISIGRIKVEKRKLSRMSCTFEDKNISVTVQVSDSIYFLGKDNKPTEFLSLKPGDLIRCQADEPGRHLGEHLIEYIEEK
jgi:3-dehydroquinate synthase II